MRILFVGDIHGNYEGLLDYIIKVKSMFSIEAVIQVGDFGFSEDTFKYIKQEIKYFPVPFYVIDGNHEDHEWLQKRLEEDVLSNWKKDFNIYYQKRGSIVRFGNTTIGFIGGALNFDQPQYYNKRTGASNYIQKAQIEEISQIFNDVNPELIISHSCPTSIGIGIESSSVFSRGIVNFIIAAGFEPGDNNDCGDINLTNLWKSLSTKPKAWVFGHFHRRHEKVIKDVHFSCVSSFNATEMFPLLLWDAEENRLINCVL